MHVIQTMIAMSLSALAVWAAQGPAPSSGDGLAEYRDGNFTAALPLLQAAAAGHADSADIHAALLSTLVYLGHYEDAITEQKADIDRFRSSPAVLAACGEFEFYAGDFAQAAQFWKDALKIEQKNARATFGFSRIAQAQSNYRTARMYVMLAHEYDPGDALITKRFLDYTVGDVRRELLPPFRAAHPWLYPQLETRWTDTFKAVQEGLGGKPAFELQSAPQEETIKFFPWMRDGRHIFGVGLDLKLEGKTFRLLFDTGASGILLDRRAVDKVGLSHVGSGQSWGVGDGGKVNTFEAIGEDCQIGPLSFSRCVVGSLDQRRHVMEDVDGLIGGDVFSDYILDIDFQKRTLHLIPLPVRPHNPQGYDRQIPPNEKDFVPVFRFGHHLMMPTLVDNRGVGLFVMDTGASETSIDALFARQVTKLSREDFIKVKGVSGEVKDVFETKPVPLIFSHFRTPDMSLIAYNLNNQPDHQEVRTAGLLGFPALFLFRLTIDYRNGLVGFDYIYSKHK